jgi:hypothetical protein
MQGPASGHHFAVESFEPYKGGSGSLLWSLNKVRHVAEHAAIISTNVRTSQGSFHIPESVDPALVKVSDFEWDSEKNEVVLAEVPIEREGVQYGFNFTLAVIMPEAPMIGDRSAGGFLEELVDVIDGVIRATEAETFRLTGGKP